ncbi:MAG: glycosyltransferase [Daejeonella sp.]|nr:glycosyltransferase [Daejeonella sp.]
MKKLAIITTHPIQYYAPVFKLLTESGQVDLKVFYTWGKSSLKKHDPGFGKVIEWDIPLLDGYHFEFLLNKAKDQGTHHFNGIKNSNAIQQIDLFNPDAILVYGWGWNSHLKILRHYKNKIPVWFRGDSTLLDQKPGFKNLLRNIFLKWVYSHIDKAFYVGEVNKAYFLKNGLKENQLIFAPHAIDNSRFEMIRGKEASAVRNDFQLAESDILMLFSGKLEAKKDPLILLEAFAQIANPNLHLLFLGNGTLEEELKLRVKNQKLKRVHFRGFQNQQTLPIYYQACDLFCLPSKGPGETWGLAINEAMACSKAVLVSDKVGCSADLVKAAVNGEVFYSNNINSLITNLLSLTESKAKLADYGLASKKMIADWNFDKIAETIMSEISEA